MYKRTSLGLFLYCFSIFANSQTVVKLGTKKEWPPYHIDTPSGADGIAVRTVACIMARINQPFTIHKKPWKRVQFETKVNHLDGFFSASQNEVRDSYATLSNLFLPQQRVFYAKTNTVNLPFEQFTLEYIQSKKIAARAGSNALHSLKLGEYNIVAAPKTQQALVKMLEEQRVDVILENSLVFEKTILDLGKEKTDYYALVKETKNMGVYFSHLFLERNKSFLERFNNNIQPCLIKFK